ncbi:MAG: polyprenyl synthetase family protein [Candidatus Omnitrophica bacterium]|nr:polyprenyl synthetase family protein [Candidatus Omnitrophota bacterium]
MPINIKNRIEASIARFNKNLEAVFGLATISPLLSKTIKEFIARKGKRIRPTLFVIGYMGYTKKPAQNLYTSALSLELLHNFMLIHDDIIDKSALRRGLPSMHKTLDACLGIYKNKKFNGQDLAIVVGDIVYAMAIHAFLSIKEDWQRKENALKRFIEAAIYTGSGEFIELLYGMKSLGEIKRSDIYKIYDLKTAHYTFCSPLVVGAVLAGAGKKEVSKLIRFGLCLGRAFQIKDDLLDMFGKEKEIGKSSLGDLKEGKKTLLLWHTYRNSTSKNKRYLNKVLAKITLSRHDLLAIKKLVMHSGARECLKNDIERLLRQADTIRARLAMRKEYKTLLARLSLTLLAI